MKEEAIKRRYELVAGEPSELTRRLGVPSEVVAMEWGRNFRRLISDEALLQGH